MTMIIVKRLDTLDIDSMTIWATPVHIYWPIEMQFEMMDMCVCMNDNRCQRDTTNTTAIHDPACVTQKRVDSLRR